MKHTQAPGYLYDAFCWRVFIFPVGIVNLFSPESNQTPVNLSLLLSILVPSSCICSLYYIFLWARYPLVSALSISLYPQGTKIFWFRQNSSSLSCLFLFENKTSFLKFFPLILSHNLTTGWWSYFRWCKFNAKNSTLQMIRSLKPTRSPKFWVFIGKCFYWYALTLILHSSFVLYLFCSYLIYFLLYIELFFHT